MAIFRDFKASARQSGAPVTVAIVILAIGCWLVQFISQKDPLHQLLLLLSPETLNSPLWTVLTYPLYTPGNAQDFFWFVLGLLWVWSMGGSVERDLGWRTYLVIWLTLTLVGVLGLWLGCAVLSLPAAILYGSVVPISAVTVIWGTRNPASLVQMMLVLPITGRWLAWLTVGIAVVYVTNLNRNPALGLFTCLPLLLGYLYAANKLPGVAYGGRRAGGSGGGRPGRTDKDPVWMSKEYLDDVKKREKEREDRERLRKLFESNSEDDPKDKG